MVRVDTFLLGLVGALTTTVSATDLSKGNVWWHTCSDCRCGHTGSREGWTGTTGCIQIGSDIRALGLTRGGNTMTTCSLFSDDNCQHEIQSMGVGSGTYACAAVRTTARSIKCYYNV